MADELTVAASTSLARLGGSPTDWAELLADRTERTATSLRIHDDTPYEVAEDLLHAIKLQVLSSPWHVGDALLEIQRLYPDEYQQLVDPETLPGGQTAANIRSICRAVPEDLRDPRVAFWNYVPLVPFLRSEDERRRDVGVGILDLAARGGWTREQINQAVRDAKRVLEQGHVKRLQGKIERMAEQDQPLPPTVTRVLSARPREVVPGSKDLKRIIDGALREAAADDTQAAELALLLGPDEVDAVARAVTTWLQTDGAADYLAALDEIER